MTELSCILVQLWFSIYFTCFLSWKSNVDWLLCFSRPWKMTTPYMSSPWNFGSATVTCFLYVTGVVCGGPHSMESSDMWRLSQRLGNFYRKGHWKSHPTMKCCDEVVKPYAGWTPCGEGGNSPSNHMQGWI
jgi:hypothetical protein